MQGSVKACSALCPFLADDGPLCSQVGRGTEHGEAEASSGPEHPETQPKGAGPAQPARFVSWIVQPSPEAALETEHPPRVGRGTCSSHTDTCRGPWGRLPSPPWERTADRIT